MKHLTLLAIVLSLSIFGCGHKDVYVAPDGSSAVVNRDASGGTHVNATDNKGDSITENISNDGAARIDSTNKDGTTVTETIGKDGMSVKDSKGESMTMSAGAVTEDTLGLPFYPGSQESKSGMTMVTDTADKKGAMSTRTTADDPDKVTAFYKDKITSPNVSSSTAGDTKISTVSGKLASGAEVSVMASKEGGKDTTILVTMGKDKKK